METRKRRRSLVLSSCAQNRKINSLWLDLRESQGDWYPKERSYLKAGLEAGTKAEAEAKHAAIQNAVFIVYFRRSIVSSMGLHFRVPVRKDTTPIGIDVRHPVVAWPSVRQQVRVLILSGCLKVRDLS